MSGRWAPLLTGAVALSGTAVLAVRSPHAPGSYGVCPLLAVAGVWCPLCGGLRAVHELVHLDLAAAWGMNPLAVLALPLLVAAWLLWLVRPRTGRAARLRRAVLSERGAWVTLAVLAVFGLARNLPPLVPWIAPGGVLPPMLG